MIDVARLSDTRCSQLRFWISHLPIGLIADYADEIKDLLNIPENKKVIIGVALGLPDRENPMESVSLLEGRPRENGKMDLKSLFIVSYRNDQF